MPRGNILITGVCGFIGSNIALSLSKNNNIIGLDNFSYSSRIQYEDIKDNINEFYQCDITKKESLEKVPKEIDCIMHFGAPSSIILFKDALHLRYSETVIGALNVFEFAKKNNIRVIYPSSGSIYGNNELIHTLNMYPKPKNIYGAAKLACEGIASAYSDFVESIGLRIFAGYGQREEYKNDFASVIYLFIKSIMDKQSPIIYGNGEQTRDFISIEDIVKIITKMYEYKINGIMDVGSGKSTSFNRLIQIINKELSMDIKAKYIKKDKDYVENLVSNNDKLNSFNIELTNIELGISKFIKYLSV